METSEQEKRIRLVLREAIQVLVRAQYKFSYKKLIHPRSFAALPYSAAR